MVLANSMSVQLATNPEGFRLSARIRLSPEVIESLATALGIFLVSRLAVLAVIYGGARVAGVAPASATSPIQVLVATESLVDTSGYLAVARNGYWFDPILRQGTPIPFPLYPWLVATLSSVLSSFVLSGAIISSVAAAIALVLLHRLVVLRLGRPDVATRACLLVALFPLSLVLSSDDARSLVLLGAVLAILAEGQRHFWLAIAGAVLASLAAPVGLVLWPALLGARLLYWTRHQVEPSDVASLVVGLAATGGRLVRFVQELVALSFPRLSPLDLFLGRPIPLSSAAPALLATGPGAQRLLILTLTLAVLALLALPGVTRSLGLGAAIYTGSIVGYVLVRLLVVGELADSAATLALAFPSAVVAAEWLKSRAGAAIAIGASALLLAVVTTTLTLAALAQPRTIALARSVVDITVTNFHVAFAHAYPNGVPPRDLYLSFDNAFVILGDQLPSRRYAPGDTISLPYYLYALPAAGKGYMLSLRLRDRAGQPIAKSDKVLWGTADASLETSAAGPPVAPGHFVVQNLTLPLDPKLPVGVYTLQTEVFALPSFARLSLVPATGVPVDAVAYPDLVVAGPADLGTAQNVVPPEPLRADSGVGLSLLGYGVQQRGRDIDVSLYWEATARPDRDYTVFVQALDVGGKVIAQSDSYPSAGAFPTSSLDPGQVIRDVHVLPLPTSATESTLRLIAGLYRLDTLQRASFHRSSEAPSDYVSLGDVALTASP
jgi:hypothetical protein